MVLLASKASGSKKQAPNGSIGFYLEKTNLQLFSCPDYSPFQVHYPSGSSELVGFVGVSCNIGFRGIIA